MKTIIQCFVKRAQVDVINQITENVLREFFYQGKEKHQWSYWTYSNYYKYLKKFLDWCIKQGWLKENPILDIKIPKKPEKLPRRLTQEQAQKILYTAFNYQWRYDFERSRNHAIIATFLYTGLRCKELLNLKVVDINLNTATIIVRNGKGGKDRHVPIYHKLKYILKRYLDDRGKLKKESDYLFTGVQSNLPLSYKSISKICQKISKESQVSFTPHQLRHTFASSAIEEGMGLVQMKEVLGHSSIASTMIYLKITPNRLRDSLNKLDLF